MSLWNYFFHFLKLRVCWVSHLLHSLLQKSEICQILSLANFLSNELLFLKVFRYIFYQIQFIILQMYFWRWINHVHVLLCSKGRRVGCRGHIFSCVRPFYEWAVSDQKRSMHRSLWVCVTHSSFIEGSHMIRNTASGVGRSSFI